VVAAEDPTKNGTFHRKKWGILTNPVVNGGSLRSELRSDLGIHIPYEIFGPVGATKSCPTTYGTSGV